MDRPAGGSRADPPVAEATVGAEETPSTAITVAVAAVSDRGATDLPPLGTVIDPDAVDALFEDGPIDGRLTFRYAGFEVVLHGNDVVEVYESDVRRPEQ